ncbi:hypothetical protein PV387_23080 [Streptomyces sp. ME02-6987-2C]|uniref:hypothetical protein n=1 Tax=unclassified Streptomyces TaxID=2593676 RepID=UPI0029A39DE5|nr:MULTISPECIES: hypothetical protein [unclassified Streptomyces]MDX3345974.1 hypothetical protein [Streptomyces sp. ME02-6979A]MDX3368886.1 hypothetical protein [Streptomyces sp. ME02-6987-2C]MDX3407783.1 hypothetical protein [Streptomyces sp. ME02-6977A]MDX3421740.1 hypothetical protein [Streptomyces sp. ME02-6985-2c]
MMTTAEVATVIHDLLAAAMDGDADRTGALLTDLAVDSDASRMFNICTVIAEAGHRALLHMYGDRAPNLPAGDQWITEQLRPGALDNDPVQAFAARFLIAHCNGDQESTKAQYETALIAGPDVFVGGVCRLVTDVAGLANAALKEQENHQ